MLGANELRIGNLVNRYYEKKYDFGSAVEWQPIVFQLDDFKLLECYDHKPIQLTEEWLFKFGFEKLNTKMSDCFVFQKGLWRVAIKDNIEKNNEWVLWHERISPPTWCLSRFEYVHQLQNLYFALTGKELTIEKL